MTKYLIFINKFYLIELLNQTKRFPTVFSDTMKSNFGAKLMDGNTTTRATIADVVH